MCIVSEKSAQVPVETIESTSDDVSDKALNIRKRKGKTKLYKFQLMI